MQKISVLKSILLFVSLFVVLISRSIAQEFPERKAVHLEVLGIAYLNSINYESRISQSHSGFGYRAGFGITGIDGFRVFSFPIGINYLFGKRRDFLELGAGMTVLGIKDRQSLQTSSFLIDATTFQAQYGIGYRRVFKSSLLIRIGVQSFIQRNESFIPWVYYGIGFAF